MKLLNWNLQARIILLVKLLLNRKMLAELLAM